MNKTLLALIAITGCLLVSIEQTTKLQKEVAHYELLLETYQTVIQENIEFCEEVNYEYFGCTVTD